jgi:hypothetical protein
VDPREAEVGVVRTGLSFDVEVLREGASGASAGSAWASVDVVRGECRQLLGMLAARRLQATFFVQGSLVLECADLLDAFREGGHEIGLHGFEHCRAGSLTASILERQLRPIVRFVEDRTGARVLGYRAPFFSLSPATTWLLDVLRDLGFTYDSSSCPLPGKGFLGSPVTPGVSRFPNGIYEIPVTVGPVSGLRVMPLGGGYFRWTPYALFRRAMTAELRRAGVAVTYFHNYEFRRSLGSPDLRGDGLRQVVRSFRLAACSLSCGPRVRRKMDRLLDDFAFCPLSDLLPSGTVGGP